MSSSPKEGGELRSAVRAADTCETPFEDAAVEVSGDHAVEEAAPEAVGALEEVFPGAFVLYDAATSDGSYLPMTR